MTGRFLFCFVFRCFKPSHFEHLCLAPKISQVIPETRGLPALARDGPKVTETCSHNERKWQNTWGLIWIDVYLMSREWREIDGKLVGIYHLTTKNYYHLYIRAPKNMCPELLDAFQLNFVARKRKPDSMRWLSSGEDRSPNQFLKMVSKIYRNCCFILTFNQHVFQKLVFRVFLQKKKHGFRKNLMKPEGHGN